MFSHGDFLIKHRFGINNLSIHSPILKDEPKISKIEDSEEKDGSGGNQRSAQNVLGEKLGT